MKVPPKLFKQSGIAKPTVWIGREGVTETVLGQIRTQLKTAGLVKAKVQRAALSTESMKDVAQRVAKDTASRLIDTRARTFTLYKKPSKP